MSPRALLVFGWLLYALPLHAQSGEPSATDEPLLAEPSAPTESGATDKPSAAEGPSVEALSEAELGALGLDAEGPRVDTSVHFWGFADFNSTLFIKARGVSAAAQGRYQNFYIGNLNLYFSKNLSESFRTMAEVRLTYLPNGSFTVNSNGFTQTDTATTDYSNGQALTRWGGIIMQRIYLEWTLHRFITVRGGQYLTPFGIWNVDHGSPVYIPAQKPLSQVAAIFPERQVGIEVFGRWDATSSNTFGYHLTLSNGTGSVSDYKDLDRNKAIGGRLYWEHFGSTYVRLGMSGYYGRDTNATPVATVSGTQVAIDNRISSQSDNLALAADLLVKHGGLRIQTEWLTLQRRYTAAGRPVHAVYAGPVPSAASADSFSWVAYALGAYRFGWYGLTPFLTAQSGRLLVTQSLPDGVVTLIAGTCGIDVSPVDSVVFKLELARVRFPQGAAILKYPVNYVLMQAAWAF